MFSTEESKRETVSKVAKILHCTNAEELKSDEIDDDQFAYNDPLFLAANVFKETLIDVDMEEEEAELARKAFLSFPKN